MVKWPAETCGPLRNLGSRAERYYFYGISTITIPVTEEDLTFLRAYSNAMGTSAKDTHREHLDKKHS